MHSHRARIVLAEKGIVIDIVSVQNDELPEDLLDLNPYHSTPTLLDRDLVLYDSRVIMEYIDERFPHPPLMPVDPVSRAQVRLALYRVEKDWYTLAEQFDKVTDKKQAAQVRKQLQESLLSQRRRLRRQALLPQRRVLAGGRERCAPAVAPARLRHRAGRQRGPAHPPLHGQHVRPALLQGEPDRRRDGDAPVTTPKRPYLLRALHQWITDNGQTPHLVVDAGQPGVAVPEQHVQDGRIILNISYSATSRLDLANDAISFDARFGGVPRTVRVPVAAVLGIYARETGEGLVFPTDEYTATGDGPKPEPPTRPMRLHPRHRRPDARRSRSSGRSGFSRDPVALGTP